MRHEPSGYWVAQTDDCDTYLVETTRADIIQSVHETMKALLDTDQPRYQLIWHLERQSDTI